MTLTRINSTFAVLLLCATPLLAREPAGSWVGSWAAAQMIPESNNALPADNLRGATLRQIVHLSAGGSMLRMRVSNAFGTGPLHLIAVHVAHPRAAASSR